MKKIIRNTAGKKIVYDLLMNSSNALSHAEIQASIGEICDRVTIYRILERLIEEGKVHKIVNTDGISKFANCSQCSTKPHTHEHVHFSCEKCKSVTCLPNINPTFVLPHGYKTTNLYFTIAGLCPACSAS